MVERRPLCLLPVDAQRLEPGLAPAGRWRRSRAGHRCCRSMWARSSSRRTAPQLAVTLEVFPDCADFACTRRVVSTQSTELEGDRPGARPHLRSPLGHVERRTHLAAVRAEARERSREGEPDRAQRARSMPTCRRSRSAMRPNTRSRPTARSSCSARALKGRAKPWSTNFDLYEVRVEGGEPRNLTADNPAWDTQPVFSPDGSAARLARDGAPGLRSGSFPHRRRWI